MMNQRFTTLWAIGATIVAISAVSFSAGKYIGQEAAAPHVSLHETATSATDPKQAQAVNVPVYTVPAEFVGAASQWRSALDHKTVGYAALFDPQRRKIIVEACVHSGYLLDAQGRPLPSKEFCEPLLWGELASLDSQNATVIDRSGRQKSVRLDLDAESLKLSFDEYRMTLIPGSKNDLLQAFEKHPDVVQRKSRYMVALAAPRSASTNRQPN